MNSCKIIKDDDPHEYDQNLRLLKCPCRIADVSICCIVNLFMQAIKGYCHGSHLVNHLLVSKGRGRVVVIRHTDPLPKDKHVNITSDIEQQTTPAEKVELPFHDGRHHKRGVQCKGFEKRHFKMTNDC